MRDSKVKKDELLKVIRENRDKHRATFDLALEEYERQQLALLEELLKAAREGHLRPADRMRLAHMPVPEEHTDDYDTAIKMLEMDVRKEFKLEQDEFRQYVMDDWAWQRSFASNTAFYAAAASPR